LKNKEIVKQFLEQVRSGKFPEKASLYMADSILAHQMNAENETTVIRTPQNYSEHIEDFVQMFGQFSFEITDLIAEEDKVYARWKQIGNHLAEIDGYQPTGNPLIEID
jgi:predicted ester cyclase